jgi:hypothetical protein
MTALNWEESRMFDSNQSVPQSSFEDIGEQSDFERLRKNKPKFGALLAPMDGEFAKVFIDPSRNDDGSIKTMFCNALIDQLCTGWFLVNEESGLKCLILPRSQDRLLKDFSGRLDELKVSGLRVLRHTKKGTALICELVTIEENDDANDTDV